MSTLPTKTREPLAPVTTQEAIALVAAMQPEASGVSAVPILLTTDELADAEYANYLEDRFGRYGV